MKKRAFLTAVVTVVLLIMSFQAPAQVSFGEATIINDDWRFILRDDPEASQVEYFDEIWRKVDLPHDWSIEGTPGPGLASCTGYLPGGIGWYRKTFKIGNDLEGKKIFICFDGVYNRSSVYLNGHLLGTRPNGYVSFVYDMTPWVNLGGDNVIAVRVDHSRSADSRWYTGSGIYRNVWLVTADAFRFDLWGVTYRTVRASSKNAEIAASASLVNETDREREATVNFQWLDNTGRVVAQKNVRQKVAAGAGTEITASLNIANPRLWSTDSPFLYTMKVTLSEGSAVKDAATVSAGIRTVRFDADKGFFLNGKPLKMKGVCIHHDAGVLGSAVPVQVWERRLKTLKETGCNAIRMSHNPQAPEVYELCDRLGFLVMDEAFDEFEFPKKKWINGWNNGIFGLEGSFDFFDEWSDRDVAAMVLRDRNHPSVVMWSIGNEVDYPNDPYSHPVLSSSRFNQPVSGGYDPEKPNAGRLGPIGKRLSGVVRSLDPSRPVTGALAGVVMTNETDYPKYLDVVGYNYTENRYAEDHRTYPARIIYGSENGPGYDAWKAVRDNEFIFGQFIWTGIDYLGEAGAWPSRGSGSGMIDLAGFMKPRGYFKMSAWADKPVTYLGTYRTGRGDRGWLSDSAWPLWNYDDGDTVRVVCYTNCKLSQLIVNGRKFGAPVAKDDKSGIIFWDVPYEPGRIEVRGSDGGKEEAYFSVQTTGRPFALTASADRMRLSGRDNVAQIALTVTDESGLPVLLSDDEVTCTVRGPAKLLGLEGGNLTDMTNSRDNVHRVHHGRMIAYIVSSGQPGDIEVTFSAPWLKPASVVLKAE